MTTPAVAPYINTYASRTPYLTVDEWINAPTACDISDLVPDGTLAQQRQSLADCIVRASSWIDEGVQQVLAATTDVQSGRYLVRSDGTVAVPLRCKPVLEVSAISTGDSPSQLAALTDLSDVEFRRGGVIGVPVNGSPGDRLLVQVTYVNGWPNTITTGAVTSGASSLPVQSAVGIYPGTVLTVADSDKTEQVTVEQSYVAGALTLPLVAPLLSAHPSGVSVSSLPPRVKEAAVLLTTALVQTRGNDAIVLAALNEPAGTSNGQGTPAGNVAIAKSMILSLRRAW